MSRAVVTSIAAIVLAVACASPAAADFPSTVTATVAAGGNVKLGSPTLPSNAKQATVDIKPAGGNNPLFKKLQILFATTKSVKLRVLTCAYLYGVSTNIATNPSTVVSFKDTDPSLAFLLLAACVELAQSTVADPGASAAASSSPCKQVARTAPITVRRSGSGYSAEIDGESRRTKRKLPLRISCKPKGGGVRLKVRPRSRKKTLRQVVGPALSLGLFCPPDAGGSVPIEATFKQPK